MADQDQTNRDLQVTEAGRQTDFGRANRSGKARIRDVNIRVLQLANVHNGPPLVKSSSSRP